MIQVAHVSKPVITDPIQYTIDDITRNYKNPLSVDQICKQFLISSRQFQRKFKKASGMTYTKMLQDIRIHESCSLLLDTSWSVQTIALEVGIHDMKYFYRIFKERCGLTPHEFRFNACSNIQ
ncbi:MULTISPECIES: helix-turn-helix transcriptional regulator [Paenibacillus]|uniref:helix-turn-helix transcriptional regulator n=1 Tax=Paenibacillus TaxID=44249 RepID=UPI000A6E2087|nr:MULTISPECIES: helix-turn-helix transcriptional regulator [Paenibacillus]